MILKCCLVQVAQKKSELEQRRGTVQRQLDEALPAVEEAREAVQGIKRQQLDEVRSTSRTT
jgi:hypothetical protein